MKDGYAGNILKVEVLQCNLTMSKSNVLQYHHRAMH